MKEAYLEAKKLGVLIDNFEAIKTQVFSPVGTRFDLSNSGWESLAVDVDGGVYPSPSLVGVGEVFAGNVVDGLEKVWRESATLKQIRTLSAVYLNSPWRFITGGYDLDHKVLSGEDPYVSIYERIAAFCVKEMVEELPEIEAGRPTTVLGTCQENCV
ncbi:SPASM domain-containing protein [Thermosulfidibacter takaii]|uniref:SPASM domain-containing protein n=1 Tax=Thermosulfidibacter takaii TaxID=412593 RepID=UPI00083964C6|nr:SPASM domain-containing protein [Thermosulfidibacter takaii]